MGAPTRSRPVPLSRVARPAWSQVLGARVELLPCLLVVAFAALPPALLLARVWLGDERHPEPGAVLATPTYGGVVPSATGRRVWAGHFAWTPDYLERQNLIRRMMHGHLSPREERAVLAGSGAEFFLADCRFPPDLVERELGQAVTPVRTFGCASVHRIADKRL
jgi:hypothetical protein